VGRKKGKTGETPERKVPPALKGEGRSTRSKMEKREHNPSFRLLREGKACPCAGKPEQGGGKKGRKGKGDAGPIGRGFPPEKREVGRVAGGSPRGKKGEKNERKGGTLVSERPYTHQKGQVSPPIKKKKTLP